MEKNNSLTNTVIPLHKSVAISLLHLEKVAAGRMRWRGTEGEAKAPSQTGYNSDWNNNATKIEALGVNHIEMLDNPKIQDIFNSILDGNADGGGQNSFFFTRRK